MTNLRKLAIGVLLTGLLTPASTGWAASLEEMKKETQLAIKEFKKQDPSITKFFDSSAGYAVIPTVGKGAFGVGGAHGKGLLYEKGKVTGNVSMSQVTIGLQLGGQTYSEVIFFENTTTLESFKTSKFAMSAQASAVAAAAGASQNAKYEQGVAVFTITKGGLMYEASVGGQKFKYEPIK